MPVTDRTRKILWARSGNGCAICRGHLVLQATENDGEALVGDECHIVAKSVAGPRGEQSGGGADQDAYNNLILLCKTDHKRVDDQPREYPPERLRSIKRDYERWVQTQLTASRRPKVRVYKAANEKNGIDLCIVPDGTFLLSIVSGCMAGYYDSEPARSEDEVQLVGGFLQEVRDWNDILGDIGPEGKVRAEFALTTAIKELADAGFIVYAGRLDRTMDVDGERSPWPVSVVQVVRIENARLRSPAREA